MTKLIHIATLVAFCLCSSWSQATAVPHPTSSSSAPTAIELFDLKSDPLEKHDMAAEKPQEITRVKELQNAA